MKTNSRYTYILLDLQKGKLKSQVWREGREKGTSQTLGIILQRCMVGSSLFSFQIYDKTDRRRERILPMV